MSVIETKLIGRGISAGSLKLYEGNLKRLNNGNEIKNLNFLKDTESIIKQIKEKKDTTARSYVIAICSIIKNDPKMKKQYDIYYNLLIEYNEN
jgi:molybdopterin synthase catalytic subunit